MSSHYRWAVMLLALGGCAPAVFAKDPAEQGPRPLATICPPDGAAAVHDEPGDVPISVVAEGGELRYPPELVERQLDGQVLLNYVVGPDGRVDPCSPEVLWSTHAAFTREALAFLQRVRFTPATRQGAYIPMLNQQAFTFIAPPRPRASRR